MMLSHILRRKLLLKQDGDIYYGWNAFSWASKPKQECRGTIWYKLNWKMHGMQMPWLYDYASLPAVLHWPWVNTTLCFPFPHLKIDETYTWSISQDYYNHWIEKDTWKMCKLLHIHFKSNNNIVCIHLIFTVVESLVQMFFRWKWSSESQKCNNTTYLFSVSF